MIEKLLQTQLERTREMVQSPDWYMEFGKARQAHLLGLGAAQAALSGNIYQAASYAKQRMVAIFEQLLNAHEVRLGTPGQDELEDQDEEREPISQIVIHHSSRREGITLSSLNALQLLNLYVPVYQSRGEHRPIYSGHFDEAGEQVFYRYHWKIGQDGTVTRLLNDEAIGWHAGSWEVNKRSVGICIDDDLEHAAPTEASLRAAAEIIRTCYPQIEPTLKSVLGHNQATESQTTCPGDRFLGGWKDELLAIAAR